MTRVSLVTLGCARNEVDSEELAARFAAAGIELVDEPEAADAVVVNTCGFVESAKKDSIDTLLAAADLKEGTTQAVIAVGCLAERYGAELEKSLPEADAILGFDDYPDIASKVQRVLAGEVLPAPHPQDRRLLLPLAPVDRSSRQITIPGHADSDSGAAPASGPRQMRRRLDHSPLAPLKIASGCDRRCTFCAIPRFRGAFISRPPKDIVDEARWLVDQGVSEVFLVSENSTSFGKDLGNIRALEELLPQLAAVNGIERVRVSYLQPAEMRPTLIDVMSSTESVARYFDLSFQHASAAVLRRMRRFGDVDSFLGLVSSIRALAPTAGIRSNIIVGFPGETEQDCHELERFLTEARLDVVGVFGYSDEDGTAAADLDGAHSACHHQRKGRLLLPTRRGANLSARRGPGGRVGGPTRRRSHGRRRDSVGHRPSRAPGTRSGWSSEPSGHRRRSAAGRGRLGAGLGGRRRWGGSGRRARIMTSEPVRDHLGDEPDPVSNWNIANALTFLRLLLVPVFVWVALSAFDTDNSVARVVAAGVFVVAAVTDLVDGELARRRHLVTNVGKVIDPIADKALTGAALFVLSAFNQLSWWVTLVIVVREVVVTAVRFWVIEHGVIPASRGGKLKTVLQIGAITLYLLPLPESLEPVRVGMIGLAVVVTVVTGVDYLVRALRLRRAALKVAS